MQGPLEERVLSWPTRITGLQIRALPGTNWVLDAGTFLGGYSTPKIVQALNKLDNQRVKPDNRGLVPERLSLI